MDEARYIQAREGGFTLVEIMVALAIGAIIISGVYRSLSSQSATTDHEQFALTMQMNARITLLEISRGIRNAGYWGCDDPVLVANTLNGAGTMDYTGESVVWINDDNNSGNEFMDGADVISLRYANPDGTAGVDQLNPSAAAIKLMTAAPFTANDIAVISDCIRYSIFQATNVNDGGKTVVHNQGSQPGISPGNSVNSLGYDYGKNAFVFKLTWGTYYLDEKNSLIKRTKSGNPQPLAENIEDLQFQYGYDRNNDGIVQDTDLNGNGKIEGNECEFCDDPTVSGFTAQDIRAVRMFVLARSEMEAKDHIDRKHYEYPNSPYYNPAVNTFNSQNGSGGVPGDGFYRVLLSTVVMARNMTF